MSNNLTKQHDFNLIRSR